MHVLSCKAAAPGLKEGPAAQRRDLLFTSPAEADTRSGDQAIGVRAFGRFLVSAEQCGAPH